MLDGAFLSHVIFWLIGGITVVGAILGAGAFFTLGRSAYRDE